MTILAQVYAICQGNWGVHELVCINCLWDVNCSAWLHAFHNTLGACQTSASWHLLKYWEGSWSGKIDLRDSQTAFAFLEDNVPGQNSKIFWSSVFLLVKMRINNIYPQRGWVIKLKTLGEITIQYFKIWLLISILNIFN